MPHSPSPSFALADVLALVRRHRWIFAGVFVLTIGAAVVYTLLQEPQYRSEARVLVRTNVNQNLFPLGDAAGTRLVRFIPSELDYIESDDFEELARAVAPGDATVRVAARSTVDGEAPNVLSFVASGPSRLVVTAVANGWAQAYVTQRHQIDRVELTSTISTLEGTATELRAQRDLIVAPLQPLDDAIAATTDPDTLSRLTTQRLALLQGLNSELAPLDSQLRGIDEQLAALQVDDSFMTEEETSARVIRAASVPASPFEPSWPNNMTLGTLLALTLALGAAYTVDRLSDRVSDTAEEARQLGLLQLASIPRTDGDELTAQGLCDGDEPAMFEGFQQLVTSLEIILSDSDSTTMLVSSAAQSEGKSTVAAGIGAVMARQGLKVLLIDADMRRPSLHTKVDVANRRGLAGVLEGTGSFDDTVLEPIGLPTLFIIPAGHPGSNPADLLRSERLPAAVEVARERFDRVIIDAPPVLPVTDATPLARVSDLVVFVVQPGLTRRGQLAQAVERLRQSGAVIGGVVENAVRRRASAYEIYRDGRD